MAKVLLDAGASADGRNGEDMTALFVVSSMCPDREAFYQEEYAKRRVLGATRRCWPPARTSTRYRPPSS